MKKILMSLLLVGVVVALMGGGLFAYFTDVEKSQNNSFQAGTLDMQIGDNNEGYGDVAVSASFTSPAALAPGDEFETSPVYFKNTGTIPIRYIFGTVTNLVQTGGTNPDAEGSSSADNIADYIKLVSYSEQATGSATFYEEAFDVTNANAYLLFWGLTQKGYITLADLLAANLAGSSVKTGLWCFDGGNDPTNPPLPVGGTAAIKFKFQLLPQTTNVYQGDLVTFDVYFTAAQTNELLDASITESVGL
ncbi:MAG: TasA family protein [Dehalococcoidia bacterium]|nr:TasA family protein [Dehalococcoidia bacterium]